MISLKDFLESLYRQLRVLYPGASVHMERIEKIQEPCISIELIGYNTRPVSNYSVRKFIDLDIIYFSKDNSIQEGVVFGDYVKDLLGLGLRVKDRFIKTVETPEMRFVDQDIHLNVAFEFRDIYRPISVSDDGDIVTIDQGATNLENYLDKNTKTGPLEYMENLKAFIELKE